MSRAVDVLQVADPSVWAEVAAVVALEPHVVEVLDARRKVVAPSFRTGVLPELARRGLPVLVRWARSDKAEVRAVQQDIAQRVAGLSFDTRRVLESAQRHAMDDVVIAAQAWDPLHDRGPLRLLLAAGLLQAMGEDEDRYHLHPELPPPSRPTLDFEEALMPETDDLSEALPGPVAVLHDLASLAAALRVHPSQRTHAGTLKKADVKRLRTRLQSRDLDGHLEAHPRWGRALRSLEILGAVSMDPVSRTLHLDDGLEDAIAGDTGAAIDRLIRKTVPRDLHAALPAVREALGQAKGQAIDELLWLELLEVQERQVLFAPWTRGGVPIYPDQGDAVLRRFDSAGWEAVEARILGALLKKLQRLGLIRRAPGVFAPTDDGRAWAGVRIHPAPPVWVSSDLEVVVPPESITPWERFQLERLGRCVARDVVDRYRLERKGLVSWLQSHALEDALALLSRRCPKLPETVRDTLDAWGQSAERLVLVRGVRLPQALAAAEPG